MALFSSSQPALRARIIPRFPARVIAGNGVTITKLGLVYTFAVNADISFTTLTLSNLTDAAGDAAAEVAGVGLGEVYRNGSVLMVRVT